MALPIITYQSLGICSTQTGSAVNISTILTGGSTMAFASCNGVFQATLSSQLWLGIQTIPPRIVPVNITNLYRVSTFINGSLMYNVKYNRYQVYDFVQGDGFTHNTGIVSGGECNGSNYFEMTMYKGIPNDGCNSINFAE